MAKEILEGSLHRPVTALFGTRSKVAVLRVLWRADAPISFREVVRRSGMAYQTIALALEELLLVGIVEQVGVGHERRVQLCASHRLAPSVANLFSAEGDFFPSLRIELRNACDRLIESGVVLAALVGPTVTENESIGAPVELLLVTSNVTASNRCAAALAAMGSDLQARFGVRLQLHIFEREKAAAMWRTRTAAAERSVRTAQRLSGELVEYIFPMD